ncbi:hypothetical protein GCM10010232_15840 [Streptomyces amakusaensis]|uniref:Uncharacterized protein n=1 Tax=Streptomyces amakusaensis TaxID=67271 RepID=A0ABW0AH56_9ACTN
MSPTHTTTEAEDAGRLIAFGLRPRLHPVADTVYTELINRYRQDDDFRLLTDRIAFGLGLRTVAAGLEAGLVLAAAESSVYETRIEDYARAARLRGDGEKLLHGVIHLAIATLSFPRPPDLAEDESLRRFTAGQVDEFVRGICDELKHRTAKNAESTDAPSDTPELERAWRAYARRPETARTEDSRAAHSTTLAMTSRALRFLTDQGLMSRFQSGGDEPEVFQPTPRYRVQVRELAATAAFKELLALGVVPLTGPAGTLRAATPGGPGEKDTIDV